MTCRSHLALARVVQKKTIEPFAAGAFVLDPKVLLMLATGTLLLLNGLIARAAASKRGPDEVTETADEAPEAKANEAA